MSWLFNPTRSEITSLDSGNIDDILSEYFESFFFFFTLICLQSLTCESLAVLLDKYAYPSLGNMDCSLHRSSKYL